MDFRDWLLKMWLDHKHEVDQWTGRHPNYTPQDYYQKYKWWLRRQYKEYQKSKKIT